MKINKTKLDGFLEIVPEPHEDERGFLVRMFDDKEFKRLGLNTKWIQESHSHTNRKNILRGLHVQLMPYSETKLIRAINGEMKWIVVDLRKDSETYGKWDSMIISSKSKNLAYVEKGFAHGCISLTDDVDLVIKSDNYFSPDHGCGIKWDDPEIGIGWENEKPYMSERDSNYSSFKGFNEKYGGIDVDRS